MAFLARPLLFSWATASRTMATSPKKAVDFFYDVLSPYSWLGFEAPSTLPYKIQIICFELDYMAVFIVYLFNRFRRFMTSWTIQLQSSLLAVTTLKILCRYRDIWNIDLRLRPVLLAGIMKESGNKPPAMLPKRGAYMTKDIMRMAKFCQVPLQLPKDFMGTVIEKGSLSAMRFITAVDLTQPQHVEAVSRELWMRIWSRDEDITQPENILAAAGKAGLSSDQCKKPLEMGSSPEVKNRLKATTDEVLQLGAFGLPCSVIYVNNKPQLVFGSDRLELLGSLLGEKWLGPVPTTSKL